MRWAWKRGERFVVAVNLSGEAVRIAGIEGAIKLYERLKGAARTVCDGPLTGVAAYQEWRSCYDAAVADAVAKVSSPLLTAVHCGPAKNASAVAMRAS